MNDGSRLTAALADRYRIERELGAGGMAPHILPLEAPRALTIPSAASRRR